MILELIGSDLQPTFAPPRKGDIRHSVADISRAREILGFEPKIDLRTGIRRMI